MSLISFQLQNVTKDFIYVLCAGLLYYVLIFKSITPRYKFMMRKHFEKIKMKMLGNHHTLKMQIMLHTASSSSFGKLCI